MSARVLFCMVRHVDARGWVDIACSGSFHAPLLRIAFVCTAGFTHVAECDARVRSAFLRVWQ